MRPKLIINDSRGVFAPGPGRPIEWHCAAGDAVGLRFVEFWISRPRSGVRRPPSALDAICALAEFVGRAGWSPRVRPNADRCRLECVQLSRSVVTDHGSALVADDPSDSRCREIAAAVVWGHRAPTGCDLGAGLQKIEKLSGRKIKRTQKRKYWVAAWLRA